MRFCNHGFSGFWVLFGGKVDVFEFVDLLVVDLAVVESEAGGEGFEGFENRFV